MRVFRRVVQRLLVALYRRRATVAVVLVLVVAATGYLLWRSSVISQAQAAGVRPIEVTVQFQPRNTGLHVLTLKEKTGERRIAMEVQGTEAYVIGTEQGYRIEGEVPRAYDLTRDVIQQLGGRLEGVVISDANSRYRANLVISTDGQTRTVQARASDAIALALRAGARVYVEDETLARPVDQRGGG